MATHLNNDSRQDPLDPVESGILAHALGGARGSKFTLIGPFLCGGAEEHLNGAVLISAEVHQTCFGLLARSGAAHGQGSPRHVSQTPCHR